MNILLQRKILYSLSQLPKNNRIGIYGNGIIGRSFKSYVEENRSDLLISCFINSFNEGETDNLTVIKLKDIEKHNINIETIIICSSQWDEIEDLLVKPDIDSYILSNEFLYNISSLKGLGSFRFTESKSDLIHKRFKKLFPAFRPESLEDFKQLINIRLTADESEAFGFLKNITNRFGLSYIDHINLKDGSVIIEGGVADGTDSVNFYNSFKVNDLKVFGFEPFVEVFNKSSNSSFLLEKGMKVYPWALWNKNELLSFYKNESSTVSSCINRPEELLNNFENSSIVNGITVDSFVEENQLNAVSLIKLDIEGAELEALQGAEKSIAKYNPQLAISIYHKKEHLYEIPEFLISINPKYKFCLGFYSPTFIDTVLYAIL